MASTAPSPDRAFLDLVERHRNELRLHCYRMLGSSHDTDDVLQEVALRAWRAKDSLRDPARLRPWLYRIATRACLDELARRPRRVDPVDFGPPASTAEVPAAAESSGETAWLEPFPDAWLTGVEADPAALYDLREGVTLAFLAAIHTLSASQRATLLLRDVLGFSAAETAEALEIGLEAANSALFRARAAVEAKLGAREGQAARDNVADEALLARYLAAWQVGDLDAFVALLHEEVRTTMPPAPTWIDGRDSNVRFYRPMFSAYWPGKIGVVRVGANGQPALAFYRAASREEAPRLRAIQVVELRAGAIFRIDHFMLPEVLPLFGLPAELPRS